MAIFFQLTGDNIFDVIVHLFYLHHERRKELAAEHRSC